MRLPPPSTAGPRLSDELDAWLHGDGDKTLQGLADVFEEKSFAVLFILLLSVSALPLPTGGATHVFEIIAVLVAAQLVLGRKCVWIPQRWRDNQVGGAGQEKLLRTLLRVIRFFERHSHPRLGVLLDSHIGRRVFGLIVMVFTVAAFLAPPFSGLDTLPSLGVVIVSLGVLLEDVVIVGIGVAVGASGIVVEIVLGKAAVKGVKSLF